jgi:prepilin-type N-terminal cleavage/methylation domain-containing protein
VLIRRLRAQDGFTLVEMLAAIAIAMVVSLAAFSLIDAVLRRTGETTGRVDATQRGRIAMDTVTRQLRSQVCLPSGTPSMFSRTGNLTDRDTATFFVDFSDGSQATKAPELHSIAFDAANARIVESDYVSADPATSLKDPAYPTTPTRVNTLATDVAAVDASTPVFRYYTFNGVQLNSPLSAADLKTVAQIKVAFRAMPPRGKPTDRGTVVFQAQVFVRNVDPNAAIPNPVCA